ncbi:MAG: LVIVD repeat-containing protein, partial [Anaerolineae bacterium]
MEARVDSWGFTRVVDLQAPGGPSLVAVITTTNTTRFPPPDRGWYSVHNPFVAGNTLYLSHYSDGVRAVDVTDPARPVERGYFVPPDLPDRRGRPLKTLVWGVYADDGLVYASDISHGLWILADPGAEAGATATTAAAPVPRTPSPPPTALPAPPPTASAPPTPTASQPPPARATATVPLPPSATPPAAGATTATVAAAPGTATVTAAHVATDAPTAVATPLPPAATSTAAGGRLEDGLHTAWLPILVTRRPSVPGDGGAQGGDHTGSQGTGLVPATEKSPGAHLGGGALEVGQGQEVVLAGSWVFDSVSVRSGGLLRGEKYAGPGSSGGTLELVADRIVVETGGHEQLLGRRGTYYDAAGFRGVVEGSGEGPGGGEGGTVTLAARRPSAGSPFPWLGAPTAVLAGPQHFTGAGAGGAYGGRGGDGMSFGARGEWQGGRAYGQAEGATVQWGSAGGAAPKSHHETASIPGGSGAGALVLRASFLRIDGSVSADGEAG